MSIVKTMIDVPPLPQPTLSDRVRALAGRQLTRDVLALVDHLLPEVVQSGDPELITFFAAIFERAEEQRQRFVDEMRSTRMVIHRNGRRERVTAVEYARLLSRGVIGSSVAANRLELALLAQYGVRP